eukprot:1205013-Pleurochrysis_carterae.AAC.2
MTVAVDVSANTTQRQHNSETKPATGTKQQRLSKKGTRASVSPVSAVKLKTWSGEGKRTGKICVHSSGRDEPPKTSKQRQGAETDATKRAAVQADRT